MKLQSIALACASLGLSGCGLFPHPDVTPDVQPLSVVLDQLKDDLNYFAATPTTTTLAQRSGHCVNDAKDLDLRPLKATVTLKAVDTGQNQGTVGLAVPVIIQSASLVPSAGFTSTKTATQTIVVPLLVASAMVADDKADTKAPAGAEPPPLPLTAQQKIELAKKHPLGNAIASFRDQILMVDHNKTPCLAYVEAADTSFKLSVQFDAVSTKDINGQLSVPILVPVKIGDQQTAASETHQTIEIALGMVPLPTQSGTPAVAPPPRRTSAAAPPPSPPQVTLFTRHQDLPGDLSKMDPKLFPWAKP